MELSYESTLDDVCEPQVRLFLRSQTFRRQRMFASFSTLLVAPATAFAILYFLNEEPNWVIVALVAIGAPLGAYLIHEDTVKKRICKFVERECAGQLPCTTRYIIQDGRLKCTRLDIETSLSLSDLKSVSEDSKRIELSFQNLALCTVPLRAFSNEAEKNAFLDAVKVNNMS